MELKEKTFSQLMEEAERVIAIRDKTNKERREMLRTLKYTLRSKDTRPTDKRCYVCCRYDQITEYHHVVTVAEVAHCCMNGLLNINNIKPIPGVYLCPNHHTILHKLYRGDTSVFKCVGEEEVNKCSEIQLIAEKYMSECISIV